MTKIVVSVEYREKTESRLGIVVGAVAFDVLLVDEGEDVAKGNAHGGDEGDGGAGDVCEQGGDGAGGGEGVGSGTSRLKSISASASSKLGWSVAT